MNIIKKLLDSIGRNSVLRSLDTAIADSRLGGRPRLPKRHHISEFAHIAFNGNWYSLDACFWPLLQKQIINGEKILFEDFKHYAQARDCWRRGEYVLLLVPHEQLPFWPRNEPHLLIQSYRNYNPSSKLICARKVFTIGIYTPFILRHIKAIHGNCNGETNQD